MRKASSIIGLKIISRDDAHHIGTVRDLVFDHHSDEVLALYLSDKELFGLIDAKIIPWDQIVSIGPDTVVVQSRNSEIRAGDYDRVRRILDHEHKMSGTRFYTEDGKDLGSFADLYVDEISGRVLGYEVSGGFISDTISGKRFITPPSHMTVGQSATIVPSEVADEMERQRQTQPGGIGGGVKAASGGVSGAFDSVKQSVAGAYDSAKESVAGAYENIASASVEKQKEFAVGKVAGRDVTIDAPRLENADNAAVGGATTGDSMVVPEGTTVVSGTTTATGNVAPQEILVRQGETITQAHADRAESAGVLGTLLIAAGSGVAGGHLEAGREKIGGVTESATASTHSAGSSVKENALNAAIGKTSGKDVTDASGALIVGSGMTITTAMMEHARLANKENEMLAAAGLGTASDGLETVKEQAGNLWETIKEKASELSGTAQEKKAELDAAAQQKRIDSALGRPVTRVILDRQDNVLLNLGEIVTNAIVDKARAAGVLDMLLDSVDRDDLHYGEAVIETPMPRNEPIL